MSEAPLPDAQPNASRAAEKAARESYGKLLAILAARFRDLDAAEDALGDALIAALETWPRDGVPASPEAWLLTAARRRLLNRARHEGVRAATEAGIRAELEAMLSPERTEHEFPDRRLALLFACAHPAIDPTARTPLLLQTVLGLDADRIADAFLVSRAAMAQRLVRTKRKIRDAGIPFREPAANDVEARLETVLEAIYAAYATDWLDSASTLADEAVWLARVLVSVAPEAPEARGLLALLLHVHARRAARRDAEGAFVPLDAQDPARWDAAAIAEAEEHLYRASRAGRIGRFQLEAAVQSAHAARRFTGATDWPAIAALYDALLALTDSPVVAVNRAVAIAEAHGAASGLAALEALADDVHHAARLDGYQPWWAARAELLARGGQAGAARAAYDRAIALAGDAATRAFLERRRDAAIAGAAGS